MIAVFLIYGSTLAVHWVLFVIAYVVLGMYFRKAHLVLRRSFAMMRGRHIWLVVAETSEHATQRLCRGDPKCVFVPILSGRLSLTSHRRNAAAAAAETQFSHIVICQPDRPRPYFARAVEDAVRVASGESDRWGEASPPDPL